MATFELWNTESGNLLGSFATEELALAAVDEAILRNGRQYGETLALGREDSRGNSKIVASGRELANRALRQDQQQVSRDVPAESSVRKRRPA